MEEARASISQTVEEIKDTVGGEYEAMKKTVAGVLSFREEFQKDPLVWSLGALSAGFALGYTLGYGHKNVKASSRRHSELAAFIETLVGELSTVGSRLVLPSLDARIRESFGFDFSSLLAQIKAETRRRPIGRTKRVKSPGRRRPRRKQ
jgi:hypothetical protein